MAYSKVDLFLRMSKETADRFSAFTDTMHMTNEQAINYLLDLHDKVGPKQDGFPEKRRTSSNLHTCVRPEIKTKFNKLASEYALSCDQLLTILIDMYDKCPECETGQAKRQADAEDTKAEGGETGDAMAELEAALDMVRNAFLRMTSESEEVKTLREQLAQSQAETRKAKEAYQRKLQAIVARLQDLD